MPGNIILLYIHMYHKWRSYDHSLPFQPPDNPENQNFKIIKKTLEDIIILHICTINDNHMMYGSWDMECDRQNFLSLWTVFCPFTPLWTQKIKILKKWKKTPEDIIILQMCTINDSHMMYDSWIMECNRQNFLSFWTVFYPFAPLTTQIKFWKNEKRLEILSFYICVP